MNRSFISRLLGIKIAEVIVCPLPIRITFLARPKKHLADDDAVGIPFFLETIINKSGTSFIVS